MNTNNSLSLKITKGDDIRRFILTPVGDLYQSLLNHICQLYGINPVVFTPNDPHQNEVGGLKLVYKDDSNHDITISSSDEVNYALNFSKEKNPLALYIIPQKSSAMSKAETRALKKKERIERKYSKVNVYHKFGITDPVEIELFRKELMELEQMGYYAMQKNLKFLVNNRNGNDFTEAKKKLIEKIDGMKKKKQLKKEKKKSKKFSKKKKKDGQDINYSEGDENEASFEDSETSKDDQDEEEVMDISPVYLDMEVWPENTFSYLYIDGNNLLYMFDNVRNLAIKQNGKGKAQEILVGAFEMFASIVDGLSELIIYFDLTTTVYEKILENNTKFMIKSARPTFSTSDDALVFDVEESDPEKRKKCLFVTSDNGLCSRLTALGTTIVKPKLFLTIVLRKIYGDNHTINLEQWFVEIEKKINMLGTQNK